MTNKELVEKYPFLVPRNNWTGEIPNNYDYSYTELDNMPDGWRIAFGEQMCEEIKQALLHAQESDPEGGYQECYYTTNTDSDKVIPYIDGYRIIEIKEKFGGLRWYDSGAPKEVYDIINKYELISRKTCIVCGKPATKISLGWISPYCDNCAGLEGHDDFVSVEEYFKRD